MRVLVGCEFSQIVTMAFRERGHDAFSCDILPTEGIHPEWHIQDDVLSHLDGWDLAIFHPPCTYLARSGARWWKDRQREQESALDFVSKLLLADIPRIALENPPGAIGSRIRPADQYIHPWQFGHPEKKMTGLWLKGLPLLVSTTNLMAEMDLMPEKVRAKCHYAAPGPNRWKERSRTLPGVARAMAEQWGGTT
jgi:hypothetical protein